MCSSDFFVLKERSDEVIDRLMITYCDQPGDLYFISGCVFSHKGIKYNFECSHKGIVHHKMKFQSLSTHPNADGRLGEVF